MPKVRGGGKSGQFASKGGKESKSSESTAGSSTSSAPKKLEEFMYAVVAKSDGGGPDILKVQLVPKPVPKRNEVLVKVSYAGVNRPDVEERKKGKTPQITQLESDGIKSKYLGLECSGTISAHGEGMSNKDKQEWKIQTKVCAIVFGGAYAEYVAVPVNHLLKIPTNFPLDAAAAIPQAACTVWAELFMKKRVDDGIAGVTEKEGSRLSSGETILIHGGCSGIGIFAIQMAKYYGATVFATAGTEAKLAKCKLLGADVCINYKKDNDENDNFEKGFVKVIMDRTNNQGVDVVFDCVAGSNYYDANLECLKKNGRLVEIGDCWMTQNDCYGVTQKLFSNFKHIIAASLVYRTSEMKAAIVKQVQENVMPAIKEGHVKAVIHKHEFTFKDAAEAHKLKESGNHIGKILLKPGKLP